MAGQTSTEAHVRAIAAARAGRHEEALQALSVLTADFPSETSYLYDYIVVLGWAGKDSEALALLPRLDLQRAPVYLLETVAKSARNAGEYALAARILRVAVQRSPDRLESGVALAFALSDAEEFDEVTRLLRELGARHPDSIQLLLAQAYAAERRRAHFDALATYQRVLDRDPTNREGLRGQILMAARVHSPIIAHDLAIATPDVLRPGELAALSADATAARIRWGAIRAARESGANRFTETDAALEATKELAAHGETPPPGPQRILLFDRLVALKDRYRMKETVALYDRLRTGGVEVPSYARLAVAEALLYLEQPESARDLYRDVIEDQPNNFAANLGLFYSLVESEQHAEAAAQIDRLVADTPRRLYASDPLLARPNPHYQAAVAARSMAPAYADRLSDAEAATAELLREAPFSMPLRENAAAVASLRGWPRRAEEELRWIIAVEPKNGIADAQRVSPLLEMHEFRDAERALDHGLRTTPEDKRVQLAFEQWKVHNLRELYVDAGIGRSSGGAPTGTRDYAIDAWLYSVPLAYDWRAFAHTHLASARFEEGPIDWQRLGAGVEHRRRDLVLTAEVSAGLGDSSGTAVALGGKWWANDHLSFSGSVQSESNSIPLQARQVGIGGRSLGFGIGYRVHESRAFAFGVRAFAFSDGNMRIGANATWSERLVTGSVYKLDMLLGIDASRNSHHDALYFNPARDFTPTITLANDWLTWRRYARSFRQRFSLTVGSYGQSGFGAGGLWGLQYEHVWEFDRRLYLRYGLGRAVHPYDGERTSRDFAILTVSWRF